MTDNLASELAPGSLRLGHVVKHIDWSLLGGRGGVGHQGVGGGSAAVAGKIAVECHRKSTDSTVLFTADYVVCTLPIGVLKDCHQHLFFPKLPLEKVLIERNFWISQGNLYAGFKWFNQRPCLHSSNLSALFSVVFKLGVFSQRGFKN